MDDDRESYLGLRLGLSIGGYYSQSRRQDPPFPLRPKDEEGSRSISPDDHNDITTNTNNMLSRKKLRLTKEQSSLLEDTFNLHTTLNPGQKQRLAAQLNLKPRQVEVWFQNRRARTKMKQTEVDCDYLRRWCEELRDENGRLKAELQHLREAYVHCPSCHTVAADRRSI